MYDFAKAVKIERLILRIGSTCFLSFPRVPVELIQPKSTLSVLKVSLPVLKVSCLQPGFLNLSKPDLWPLLGVPATGT